MFFFKAHEHLSSFFVLCLCLLTLLQNTTIKLGLDRKSVFFWYWYPYISIFKKIEIKRNKLGLSCAKLRTALASFPLAFW